MAVKSRTSTRGKTRGKRKSAPRSFRPFGFVRRWLWRTGLALALLAVCVVLLFRVVNPPTTHTIWSESRRLDGVQRTWVDAANIAPVMLRSAVAAEDANFCTHWGFDMDAIRAAIDDGASRGQHDQPASGQERLPLAGAELCPQGIGGADDPLLEALWPKRRILEVYLNVAEFDEGVFGVDAAARHYFGVSAGALTDRQAALLASVLPNPKEREANRPSAAMNRRAATIMDGAALIAKDGRAACFEN